MVQRHIHSFAWAPRDALPATVQMSSAQVAATDDLHFKPDYLPGHQLRAVFME
ncbi:hypothetical protein Pmar_PMAR016170 [Perkinsus marinus ATCC 50983]|uniref:Uncharacterized protein n=1 Tax=Perkinsus marinus (strain ATCC 50983 / TXsc) TaxID=423536 RepID=C5LVL3_PERM5|nr:hypothetical protein Pmar_PMAR016170 [Perkinsus marinus ATCC 50983]EEQ99228.1 hypothetical protein Pmar_PMAR016170 [Perkinsus marinus ATCC 50983]|eukprot:XP_002766511.1 hypothetical protein Pmar_PMAR016170 [Perkinsus marinus ATCC 50983]